MKYIDLHVHSNASDGTLSPAQVVGLAARQNLAAIALTDHDTTDGLCTARQAAVQAGIELVPGIEFSCVYQNTEIHILGLFIREDEPSFFQGIKKLKDIRSQRNEEMLRRFQADNIPISLEELQEGNPGAAITRAHFARLLVKKGYAPTLNQAFQRYLQYGGRYCIRKEKITPMQVMELLRENRAFPSLAHIMQYKLGWEENERLIIYLKELGLLGLEVYHSSHNDSQSRRLLSLAQKHGLLPTGGSDFHGENKPDIRLGTGRGHLCLPYELLSAVKSRMGR